MNELDLNLLSALDALLDEASVTRAAKRLGLSTSAMSRTLARLRSATGDPLLVRAGRQLVLTTHAVTLRDHVHALNREVHAVLQPPTTHLHLTSLERTFTIRAGEGFVEFLAAPLMATVGECAPHVRLRFVMKADKETHPLREGNIDLDVGVPGPLAPEIRIHPLFRDRLIGVVRVGHPLLTSDVSAARYAACRHVVASRRGQFAGQIDEALAALELRRTVPLVVPTYPEALRVVRTSDLVTAVPESCLGNALTDTQATRWNLERFALPVVIPDFEICAMWHPYLENDPAHRWLRETVAAVCRAAYL
ncbi:LysR family transcriptional regulator [Deinococcus ruber]|nr:LysR family transcriptional regulator [Deinococcus ruber]